MGFTPFFEKEESIARKIVDAGIKRIIL